MRQRPLTLLLLLPVLAAAALLAAGCGGTSNSSAAASSTTTTFTACLKAQGVTLPSGGFFRRRSANGQPPAGGGGGAFNNPKTRAAFQACRKYLPNGGRLGRGGRPGGFNSAPFTKYRTCLTAHGVKFTGGGAFGGANVASPAFQAAAKACRSLAPTFGGGGAPPTATTG